MLPVIPSQGVSLQPPITTLLTLDFSSLTGPGQILPRWFLLVLFMSPDIQDSQKVLLMVSLSYLCPGGRISAKNIFPSCLDCVLTLYSQTHSRQTSLTQPNTAASQQPEGRLRDRQRQRQMRSLYRAGDEMSTCHSVIRPPLPPHDIGPRFLCLLR